MIRLNQLKIKTDQIIKESRREGNPETKGLETELLKRKAAGMLHIPAQEILNLDIVRKSIDARKKPELFFIYTVDMHVKNEERILKNVHKHRGMDVQAVKIVPVRYCFPEIGTAESRFRPVIIGMGPAGIFCGYFLALHGYKPVLLERGRCVEERQKDVENFWERGVLDPESNVQFGEGGAGTFSDGKLNTLVKDKEGRNRAVLETLVHFGAKESVLYEAKPHIGTDVLKNVVKAMREEIIRLGGTVRFESRVTDICIEESRVKSVIINGSEELPCERLVLAVGHSARDTFFMLYERAVPMEAKAFAVGLRVEHPQKMINYSQYGREETGDLGAAAYKVTAKTSTGRGVYSFCMCPGGYVVNASSEERRIAVNGMSYSGRNGCNANSAVIVAVTPQDFGSDHPLAGIAFQRSLEEKAFQLGAGKIPMQRYGEFRKRVKGEDIGNLDAEVKGDIQPQCKGGCVWADLSTLLPKECNIAFVEGMEAFGRQIAGFDRPDVILSGVESRTSSPLRIPRDGSLQSVIRGLYPCGEGAGYAGGITSAAMDGIRAAEAIASECAPCINGIT